MVGGYGWDSTTEPFEGSVSEAVRRFAGATVSASPLVRFTPDNVASDALLSKTMPGFGISANVAGEAIIAAVSPEAALWIIMTPPEIESTV